MKHGWLKIDAGSEYDSNWHRFFSVKEEERVTHIAESVVSSIETSPSATSWHKSSTFKSAYVVLVLHQRNRLLRGRAVDGERQYVETCFKWDVLQDRTDEELRTIIFDRVIQVFDALRADLS